MSVHAARPERPIGASIRFMQLSDSGQALQLVWNALQVF